MMNRIHYLFLVFWLLSVSSTLAQNVSGTVTGANNNVLTGANVHWLGTTIGTSTDAYGHFEVPIEDISDKRLVFSFVGYRSDTVAVGDQKKINVRLKESNTLDQVEIKGERPGTFISSIEAAKTEVITQKELKKAACCDLAGCFDTQASVLPNTTNVVTNSKELRILGLSGVYNQVLIDGMPLVQGLTYTYGISTIPGTLVDNIYVAKGANSVLQGFESISGQINVELKEPDDSDKLLLNAYVNSFFETQFNANYTKKWNKWSTLLAAHTSQPGQKFDLDEDAFLDLPLITRYSLYNKWKYGKPTDWGWHSHIGIRYVNEERIGGQVDFDPCTDQGTTNNYGQSVTFSQPELYTKTGYRFDDKHHLVIFGSAFHQDQNSYFGTARYQAEQLNAYANLQYELTWLDQHDLKAGVSYRHMALDEDISFGPDSLARTYAGTYRKHEQIPGVFVENVFNWRSRAISLITGIRADKHDRFGWFVTPRALFKYNFTDNTTARVSIGTGWRTVNLFSENINLLASSRDVIITQELRPEQAINYGANLTQKIFMNNMEAQLTFDLYHTEFQNQVFPDYNLEPAKAYVYNFTGTSISNGFQAELGLEFIERVGVKLAYNFLDVYRIINGEKDVLPFNPKHRVTGTFSYKPQNEKWHVDMNLHWFGKQRQANTSGNPPEYQLPKYSEPYTTVNAQITKNWKTVELYLGCENIFDFRQLQPILSWEDPFGPYFDTSTVWGPTRGREVYLGVRWILR